MILPSIDPILYDISILVFLRGMLSLSSLFIYFFAWWRELFFSVSPSLPVISFLT